MSYDYFKIFFPVPQICIQLHNIRKKNSYSYIVCLTAVSLFRRSVVWWHKEWLHSSYTVTLYQICALDTDFTQGLHLAYPQSDRDCKTSILPPPKATTVSLNFFKPPYATTHVHTLYMQSTVHKLVTKFNWILSLWKTVVLWLCISLDIMIHHFLIKEYSNSNTLCQRVNQEIWLVCGFIFNGRNTLCYWW